MIFIYVKDGMQYYKGVINHSEKQLKKIYNGCEVCEEWRYFPKFKEWFNLNYIKGWEIDKDVLFKGNKLYSPETCCFLPKEVNSFFTIKRRRKKGNLPLGVFKQYKRFFCGK